MARQMNQYFELKTEHKIIIRDIFDDVYEDFTYSAGEDLRKSIKLRYFSDFLEDEFKRIYYTGYGLPIKTKDIAPPAFLLTWNLRF